MGFLKLMHGKSIIQEDLKQRGVVVDNAFRPGKGSKPRPIRNMEELGDKLEAIFKWKSRKKAHLRRNTRRMTPAISKDGAWHIGKNDKHPFAGIIP